MTVKRHKNRKSEEFEELVVESYLKKQNLALVAIDFKIHSTSVSRIVRRFGIDTNKNKVGSEHPNWKGGKIFNKGDGYIGIWNPTHERADGGGYVYEHTLVYEKEKGRLPIKNEVLHHIDLDKHNNDINNLYLCNSKEHILMHRQIEKLIKPLMNMGIVVFKDGEYQLTA